MKPLWLYTVRYRRSTWESEQSKVFFSQPPARRLIKKLLGNSWDWSHLSPMVTVRLTKRPLGEEVTIGEWDPVERTWRQ